MIICKGELVTGRLENPPCSCKLQGGLLKQPPILPSELSLSSRFPCLSSTHSHKTWNLLVVTTHCVTCDSNTMCQNLTAMCHSTIYYTQTQCARTHYTAYNLTVMCHSTIYTQIQMMYIVENLNILNSKPKLCLILISF